MKLVKDINKESSNKPQVSDKEAEEAIKKLLAWIGDCLLYTSPSPRDAHESRMPSSA